MFRYRLFGVLFVKANKDALMEEYMKKLLLVYSIALIIILIGCSFLASHESIFVTFVYSVILGVMLLSNIVLNGFTKALVVDLLLIIIFVALAVYAWDRISYENIFAGIFPLSISLYRTFGKLE